MNAGIVMVQILVQIKKELRFTIRNSLISMWTHLGLNQGPPDYESGALTSWAIGPESFSNSGAQK